MTVTADDLDSALAALADTLEQATDRNWSTGAGALEWDCWRSAPLGDTNVAPPA